MSLEIEFESRQTVAALKKHRRAFIFTDSYEFGVIDLCACALQASNRTIIITIYGP